MAPRYVSGDKWFLGIQSQGFLASHLSPWPPRFYAMAPWRPPWLFLLASSHHVLALSSHTGLAGHRAPGTHEACSQLITCALSSVRSPFPPRSLYLLHHLSLSSHAIFPKRLLITQSNFQFKPTHPRSQHSHPVPALSSFWHVLWFEAILLVYLFTCLLRLSSPRQGEALSLLLGAGPKTRKGTCAVIGGRDGTPTPHPRATAPWHVLRSTMPMHLWPHSLTPSSSVQMRRHLKPWEMLPNTHFPPKKCSNCILKV